MIVIDLSDYKDVAERCAEFFERYPEGSLQSDFLGFDATGKFVIVRAVDVESISGHGQLLLAPCAKSMFFGSVRN